MSDIDYVVRLIRDEYARLDNDNAVAISPAKLADIVFSLLDPGEKSPHYVQTVAILELRQLARTECAKQHLEGEAEVEQQQGQQDLFEYRLQGRYPARRDNDDVYVLLAELTPEELDLNVRRLRNEAAAKAQHADTLRNYRVKKFGNGDDDLPVN